MRDITYDVTSCSWVVFLRYGPYNANDVRSNFDHFALVISKQWIPLLNCLLDENSCKHVFDIRLFFQAFNYDFWS